MRRIASILACSLLAGALVAAASAQRPAPLAGPSLVARALAAHASGAPLGQARLAQVVAGPWHGGPTTTSTGETVDVRVSDALPPEASSPQQWADFLTSLMHGSEISQLTMYVETLDEVQEVCGTSAIGCYGQNQLIVPGLPAADVTPEEVIRHEYGHHIAFHRSNPPWDATDWGPKRWASAENVCSLVRRSQAYPGDEGQNYMRNPGEAWAETYRLADEARAGITTQSWNIVAQSFFPSSAILQAAQQDVLQPWTGGRRTSASHAFGKRTSVWWMPLSTPLDGTLRLSATVPARGAFEVALVASNRKTVVRRAQFAGQREKRLETSICGTRSLFVRVTSNGTSGRVRISATTP